MKINAEMAERLKRLSPVPVTVAMPANEWEFRLLALTTMDVQMPAMRLLKMTDEEVRVMLSLKFLGTLNDLMDRLKQSDNWRKVEDE